MSLQNTKSLEKRKEIRQVIHIHMRMEVNIAKSHASSRTTKLYASIDLKVHLYMGLKRGIQ